MIFYVWFGFYFSRDNFDVLDFKQGVKLVFYNCALMKKEEGLIAKKKKLLVKPLVCINSRTRFFQIYAIIEE